MAVIFDTIPKAITTSDNPLTYVFRSSLGGTLVSFLVETILNGSVVEEERIFPVTTGYGYYDCSPVVSRLMNSPRLTTDLVTSMDTIYTLQLRVTEEFTATTGTPNSSLTVYTFKGCLSPSEWENVDFPTDYLTTKWLTDVPNNTNRVVKGADVICSMLVSGAQDYRIRYYDSNDTLLDTYLANETALYWQMNLSSANISAVYGGVDFNDVAYFTVQIDASEILTFIYVDEYCNGIHSLLWLNKYGTYDQYPIEHNVTSESDIQPSSYIKKYGSWTGTDLVYDSNNSGNIDFQKTIKDKGSLVTNYMTDTIQNWFVSAYDSIDSYLYDTTGLLFRLTLSNTGYKTKQGRFDDLIMEELQYKKTTSRNSVIL